MFVSCHNRRRHIEATYRRVFMDWYCACAMTGVLGWSACCRLRIRWGDTDKMQSWTQLYRSLATVRVDFINLLTSVCCPEPVLTGLTGCWSCGYWYFQTCGPGLASGSAKSSGPVWREHNARLHWENSQFRVVVVISEKCIAWYVFDILSNFITFPFLIRLEQK